LPRSSVNLRLNLIRIVGWSPIKLHLPIRSRIF
jgi:hypothetical protein